MFSRVFADQQFEMATKTLEVGTLDQVCWLVERLLALLSSMAAAGKSEKAAEFRLDLNLYRRRLAKPRLGESLDETVRKCLALCQDYFQQGDSFRVNNEAEY